MLEKIYTIPINECFDASMEHKDLGCPFCNLEKRLEQDELELILGASMMEPDIRIKTNEMGFCKPHFEKMLTMKNRLGLALMLESHLNELREDITPKLLDKKAAKATERIKNLEGSCYVCSRVENSMEHMYANAALLWDTEAEFKKKLSAQPWFCMEHFRRFVEAARINVNKKRFSDFYSALCEVQFAYFDELRADVSHFCKKFDYRYENEPWGNAKDAPDRAIKFLRGI